MESIVRSNHHVRFRDFSLDPQTRELFCSGEKQRIYGQPLELLAILIAHPGELVTREALQKALWPEGTFVDFENSLNSNVKRLREALGDDPASPRFIETVPRLGYRFIAPVERPEAEFSGAVQEPKGDEPLKAPPSVTPAAALESALPGSHRRNWTWLIAAGAGFSVLLGAGYLYLRRPLPLPHITAYTQITHDGRRRSLAGTDGSRLYFTQLSSNSIAQVGINGGEISHFLIALPGRAMALVDISPDGSNALIYTLEEDHTPNGQWVVPILGGAPKRLEDADGGAFSPDGKSVIYSTPNGDVFITRIDGTGRHKLAYVGPEMFSYMPHPAVFQWSPDGKVIRFYRDGLWEMSADGAGIHRLLSGWKGGVPCCGRWTQDGNLYIFVANNQIWALDERRSLFRRPSSDPIQLTSGPIRWGAAVPGRDGITIFGEGQTPRGEMTRIDPKTGTSQPFLDGISAEFVSFSPNGNFVAYVAFPGGTLWRANRDGSNRLQLTEPPDYAMNARWSPDSKEILFHTYSPDQHGSMHRVIAADGSSRWLPFEEGVNLVEPNWSPDGTKVVFGHGDLSTPKEMDLRIVDLNTRQVTVVPGSTGKWSPRWSPDGRYISAQIYPQMNRIPVFDLKLHRWSEIPVNGEVEFPDFSHDGKFIWFVRYGTDHGVFRVPVTGGKEERVVNLPGWYLTGHFGYSMSLDPTDAPLVLRDASSDDIYALTLERR